MADKKLVFFDIDGTLWDFHNQIPDSCRDTLHRLKANGHEIFLCSGRAMAHITDPSLLSIGFDGIVSGCGTGVSYHDKVLHSHVIPVDILGNAIDIVRGFGMRPVLEGHKYLYMDSMEWEGDPYYLKLLRDLGDDIREITDNSGEWPDVCKFSCDTTDCDIQACYEKLKGNFHFIIHTPHVVEMVPNGYTKASGIRMLADYLGVLQEDIFAFGDSYNDAEMIEYAGTGIAMGNGTDEIKAIADYVTTPMKEDGIRNACLHFGLI